MDDRVTTLDTVEKKETYFARISPCIPRTSLINFPSAKKNRRKKISVAHLLKMQHFPLTLHY